MNTGGYMSFGDDPARLTWFDEEMQVVADTARPAGGRPHRRPKGASECCGPGRVVWSIVT